MADAERRVQSMPLQRLDRDLTRLTTFPIPGFSASTLQDSEDGLSETLNSAVSSVKARPPPVSGGKQYWMPDHLCKVCYNCSAAFTLFRRRHHCRLCGQIFCYDCSNNFISGTPHDLPGVIRVCTFCLHFADAAVKNTTIKKDMKQHSVERLDSDEMSQESFPSPLDKLSSYRHSGEWNTMKPSPLIFGSLNDQDEAPALLSPVESSSSDSGGFQQSADLTTLPGETFEEFKMNRKYQPRPKSRRRRYSTELLGAIEGGGLMEAELMTIDKEKQEASSRSKSFTDLTKVQEEHGPSKSKNIYTQREVALDKYMQFAHDRIRDGIKEAVSALSNSLPKSEFTDLDQLAINLEDLAFVVTGHLLFSMNFRSPSGFNYSNLVKVKSIAMPDIVQTNKGEPSYDFNWLAGTVCHKHLSHKQMAQQVVNPRILLFACGISYDRSNGAGRMSSLDTLLEQEKSYMGILVDKISALEPDIIFVEKTVSRYAQELLCERRISIVLNVKIEMLHRISRHIGAEIITMVDHVDKANPAQVVGRCRSFTAKSIPVIPDKELPPVHKPSQALTDVFMKAHATPSRLRMDTYLYLDGCDPLNGCTVLITGPYKPTLRLLKQLTRSVLSMTYKFLLEAHVLSDFSLSNSYKTNIIEDQRTTWCTTSTLRVRDPGSANPRYHQCVEAQHLCITAYSDKDVSFGNFLNQELAALSLECQNSKCNYLMADHAHTFSCRTGTIVISFEELPNQIKQTLIMSMDQKYDTGVTDSSFSSTSDLSFTMGSERDIDSSMQVTPAYITQTSKREAESATLAGSTYPAILFWRWCRECKSVISPFIPLEKYVYKYSFARFLEVLFAEAEGSKLPKSSSTTCTHSSLKSHVLFLNIGNSVARFDYIKQVSLRLSRINSNCTTSNCDFLENMDQVIVKKEVFTRIDGLKWQLISVINSFTEKVQEINHAVDALEWAKDNRQHARLVLEVMCISKMVRSGHAIFSHKLTQLKEPASSLGDCDSTQRALYFFACKWITCMLRLRKIIKKHLTTYASSPAPNCNSITLGGITFQRATILSPTLSPLIEMECTQTPSTIAKELNLVAGAEPLARRRSSAALSSMTASKSSTHNAVASSSTIASAESFKRPLVPILGRANSIGNEREPRAGWKDTLLDLYRVIGRSNPEHDITIDLPDMLTAGHPSLPQRSKCRVVLVDETMPITYVAYALTSDSYEEEMDGWKLRVHNEAIESVATQNETFDGASTDWLRAALKTRLNAPFKLTSVEMPLHVSLLSGKTSSSMSSSCWELSMIAYYPLQFEVLRELFCGDLQNFVFSISHVANWDANGGKSGASFYRSLDDRFIIKHISSKEMQSFLGCLSEYFSYMASVYFNGRASLLSKTVGLYQTTMTRKDSGQKVVQYICVMENAFYRKQILRAYDLKGSIRNRFTEPQLTCEDQLSKPSDRVLLDGNFLEFTKGHPMGVIAEDHQFILKAVQNDTDFLCSINIVDYSMVLGLSCRQDDTGKQQDVPSEMIVGIIDYLRQFDLIKRVESVGKSVGMIAGQSSPTIIEPSLYGKRFKDAIRRYFMPVSPISSGTNDD